MYHLPYDGFGAKALNGKKLQAETHYLRTQALRIMKGRFHHPSRNRDYSSCSFSRFLAHSLLQPNSFIQEFLMSWLFKADQPQLRHQVKATITSDH